MPKKIQAIAKKVLEIQEVLGGRHLVSISSGPSLDLVLLSLEQAPDYRTSKRRATKPNHFRLHFLAGDDWTCIDLHSTPENYHFVQPLPGNSWLLVRGRASGVADQNAHVYEADGTIAYSFHAGDGIADVQATERGNIWISYFDEGVFGNTPLGQAGLVSLDDRGSPVLRLNDMTEPVLQSMADCYALNVCSDREVWFYFYTDFPLVRMLDKKVAAFWMLPIAGSHAFAVDGEWVLLAGGYSRKESLFLGRLNELEFEEITPVDERGQALQNFRAFGRRHLLFLASENTLRVIDLRSL